MTKKIKKYWECWSSDYQKDCKIPIDIHYGPGSPNEKQLKLLGNLKGKDVLEIGCGGAQCGIAMAKLGAHVTGMDLSEEQLKFANNLARKNKVNIKFYQRDVKDLKPIKSNSQDIVFSAFALQYVDDLSYCFKEVMRVLKKNGLFVFSIDHPFYKTINPKTLKFVISYFKTGKITGKNEFEIFNHTVGELFSYLIAARFSVEKIVEPDSRKKYENDPWYGQWNYYLPETMKLIPPTIIFKARKKL